MGAHLPTTQSFSLFPPPTLPQQPSPPEQAISLSRFNQLQADNEALTASVQKLEAQLQLLLSRLPHNGKGTTLSTPRQPSKSAQAQANMSMDSALSQMTLESD